MATLRLEAEPVKTLAFGAIGAGYTSVGSPFSDPVRILFIQNLTDVTLMFSFDGVMDNFPLPANGFLLLDITTNRDMNAEGLYMHREKLLYVKQVGVPTSGAVYITGFFAEQ